MLWLIRLTYQSDNHELRIAKATIIAIEMANNPWRVGQYVKGRQSAPAISGMKYGLTSYNV